MTYSFCGILDIFVKLYSTTTPKMDSVPGKIVTLDNMNPHLKTMEYAVRGPLVIRATQIEKELGQASTRLF